MGQEKSMRLDRFLAEMKQGTRSQVKDMIRKGRVKVDGTVCKDADRKVLPMANKVTLDSQPIGWAEVEYYMLNKPQGVVSATEDGRYKTVTELIRDAKRKDLFPVGRLDIDTEGLLLITNDGALAHELLAPKKHVDKVYFARVRGTLKDGIEARFKSGITLSDGTKVQPADLIIEKGWNEAGTDFCEAKLTIREGKFHQVKRMFETEGGEVIYLKRLSMGTLVLDETLKTGEYRPLTEDEIKSLKQENLDEIQADEIDLDEADNKNFGVSVDSTDIDYINIDWNQVEAVIFDLDGTLVDSMWMWKAIDVEFLGRYGYDCPENLQKDIEGMSFSETAVYFKDKFKLPMTLDEIKAIWIEMSIDKYRHEVPPKPGILDFLPFLKKQGIRMGIATSNAHEMVNAVLDSLGLRGYFDVVATACEVAAGKPAPDIYLKVAADLGVNPEKCLVFEDVPAGIMAGKRAGMRVGAVEDDFSLSMTEEKKKLADFYIKNYHDCYGR